ncbi:hypothetical protein ASD88_24790 [Pelomonas sp. Root662]|nr:hypothetical protein ASC81_24790 [Pelomonas sp. Root405]KRA67417.1 hypothetical protein ASD88_24790 [Pelomonas sp. Root662]
MAIGAGLPSGISPGAVAVVGVVGIEGGDDAAVEVVDGAGATSSRWLMPSLSSILEKKLMAVLCSDG